MGIYVIYISVTLLLMCRHVLFQLMKMKFLHYVCITDACVFAHSMETGQRARRLSLGRERVQQARSRQTEQQREWTRQVHRDRRRQARTAELMLEGMIFCVDIHTIIIIHNNICNKMRTHTIHVHVYAYLHYIHVKRSGVVFNFYASLQRD